MTSTSRRGFEVALGAALGDDLEAGLDESAPARWSRVSAEGDPALPSGAEPLSALVSGPPSWPAAWPRSASSTAPRARDLHRQLKPGQRLVSRDGDLWRWDGFIAAADAPTAAAKRLAERNRLGQLEEQVAALLAQAEDAERRARSRHAKPCSRAQQQEKHLRDRWRQLQSQAGARRATSSPRSRAPSSSSTPS